MSATREHLTHDHKKAPDEYRRSALAVCEQERLVGWREALAWCNQLFRDKGPKVGLMELDKRMREMRCLEYAPKEKA